MDSPLARRDTGDSWSVRSGRPPRSLTKIEEEGARRRQIAIEQGKLLATQLDVIFTASGYAAQRADELIRTVATVGVESERSELVGGRFVRSACAKAEMLVNQLYGPLGP